MDSFTQDHEVEGLRNENVRLLTENRELRKMVGLMQENLELRYTLRDHGTMVHSLVPPPPSKDQGAKHGMAASHKDSGPSAAHLNLGVVGPHMGGHGEAGHGGDRGGTHVGGRSETHGRSYGSGYSSLKDSSPSKSPTSSLDSQPEQHITGHRKLLASVTKLRTQGKGRIDSAKGNQMQRRMVEEG
ncbi:hypothetical protein FKM82_003649 [Ascaphus truei]